LGGGAAEEFLHPGAKILVLLPVAEIHQAHLRRVGRSGAGIPGGDGTITAKNRRSAQRRAAGQERADRGIAAQGWALLERPPK
jgi:hypothetical protein